MPVRFHLVYTENAEQALAALWLSPPVGSLPTDVQWAADQLEKDLRVDAHMKGDPASGHESSVRRYEQFPLAVLFRVSEDDRQVIVLDFEPISSKS